MTLVLISDIFGRTAALETLAKQIDSRNHVCIIDPYGGGCPDFESEEAAYSHFMNHIGIERYQEQIQTKLATRPGPFFIVAFSMGASALWISLSRSRFKGRAIGYYGSQIRHYTHLEPSIPVTLVFPESEPHFDVPALVNTLSEQQTVTCQTLPYSHGFMNPWSVNFNKDAYQNQIRFLSSQWECMSKK